MPVHTPAGTSTVAGMWFPAIAARSGMSDVVMWYHSERRTTVEDDEEAQLKALQASLAM